MTVVTMNGSMIVLCLFIDVYGSMGCDLSDEVNTSSPVVVCSVDYRQLTIVC